jgi:hypothetical protein
MRENAAGSNGTEVVVVAGVIIAGEIKYTEGNRHGLPATGYVRQSGNATSNVAPGPSELLKTVMVP